MWIFPWINVRKIQNDSVSDYELSCSLCEGRTSFFTRPISRKLFSFWLALHHAMSYFFFLFPHLLFLCVLFLMLFENENNEVPLINPSADVLVFEHLKVNQRDWLIYSGSTDRPSELCYNFSISNDLIQMVNFPTRISDFNSDILEFWSFGFIYFIWC